MKTESIIALLGVIIGALIAVLTIHFSNRNNRQQIKTGKLEELYQAIQILSRYYGVFMELYFRIEQLRDLDDKELQTLNDYFSIRDQKLTIGARTEVSELLSRIDVLANCYTKGVLKNRILKYEDLMYSFFDLILNGGSIHHEIGWKNGFPEYEEFYKMIVALKETIVKEINK